MKTRIISAAIALALAAFILFMHKTVIFVIGISLVSALIEFELLRAVKVNESKPLFWGAVLYNIAYIFFIAYIPKYIAILNILFVIYSLLVFIAYHTKLRYEKFFAAVASAVLVSASLSCIINLNKEYSILHVIMALGLAWVADTFAYFVGSAIGKHKLSPVISPKKSVEGFVGGIVGDAIVLELVYIFIINKNGSVVQYLLFLAVSIICAALGTLGDLSASVIKRQTGIKDYGKIMPGHGGALDRFDSVLVVAPAFYIFVKLFAL